MKDFTKFSIKRKLDEIEKSLETIKHVSETCQTYPEEYGVVSTTTINNIFDSISSILDVVEEEMKMDLFELKVLLHHMEALPIRNEEGELE